LFSFAAKRIGKRKGDWVWFGPFLRDDGPEQLISNGGWFKPTFAGRDKNQTMRNLGKLVLKNQFDVPA
jgi:hypothetical protein